MVGILAVFAELERSKIKERMLDGKEGRAKEGKYRGGGYDPIGYDYDPQTEKLNINEYEAVQVREIFELFNQRVPISAITTLMNDKGYRTKYGIWKDITVRNMVSRRLYIGDIEHKGQAYEGQHDAIISIDVWDKAQKVVEERAKEYENRKIGKAYKSPLGGIIYCGCCGSRYHFRSGATRKDGTRRNYYTCYSRSKGDKHYIKDPNCKNKNYRDIELDEIIFNEIRKLKTDPEYVRNVQNSVDNSHKIDLITTRIKQIDSQVSKLMDLYSMSDMDMDTITAKVKPLNDEKKSLTHELASLTFPEERITQETINSVVEDFEKVLKSGDCQKIHAVVCILIDKVVINGEDIEIHWAF